MAIVPNGAIEVVKKNTNPLADVAAKIQSINNNPVQGPLTYPQFNNSGQTMSWNNTINTQTGVPQNLNLNTTTNTVQPVSPTPAPVNNNTNTNTQTNTNVGATTTKTPSESDKVISEIRDYLNNNSTTIPDGKAEVEKQKQADLEALKANIAAKVSTINTDISGAQNKFQPLRENVDVQRAQNLQRVKEMMASQGVFGGDNLTANIGVNTQASNNISQIDQQQASYVKSLEDQIRQLQLAQTEQEANIISKAAAANREVMYKNAELAQNEKNTKVSNLFSLLSDLRQKEQNSQTQDNWTTDRNDNLADKKGLVFDPTSGSYVKTADQIYKDTTMEDAKRTKTESEYLSTIGRFANDYQKEINNVQNDGDPSNDWQVPFLQTKQQEKKDKMLQDSISTISQYSNDYQKEINNRMAANPNDPLIPYLKIARAEKIAKMDSAKLTAAENQQKNALEYFKQLGYATPEIASILGIPAGSKTADYIKTEVDAQYKQGMLNNDTLQTQYNITKPYYNPNSGSGSSAADIRAEKAATRADNKDSVKMYSDYIDNNYVDPETKKMNENGEAWAVKYIKGLVEQGESREVVNALTKKYNLYGRI